MIFGCIKKGKACLPPLAATFLTCLPITARILNLQHLHFKAAGFPLKLVQFKRTSGYVLVYCPGFFNSHCYLLIAIIKHWDKNKPNDVDNTDRDSGLMNQLEKIAEGFREQF